MSSQRLSKSDRFQFSAPVVQTGQGDYTQTIYPADLIPPRHGGWRIGDEARWCFGDAHPIEVVVESNPFEWAGETYCAVRLPSYACVNVPIDKLVERPAAPVKRAGRDRLLDLFIFAGGISAGMLVVLWF